MQRLRHGQTDLHNRVHNLPLWLKRNGGAGSTNLHNLHNLTAYRRAHERPHLPERLRAHVCGQSPLEVVKVVQVVKTQQPKGSQPAQPLHNLHNLEGLSP